MKLTNLINNVNKQILSIMSSVWNWFNGLLIGTMAGAIGVAIIVTAGLVDEFGIVLAQDKKKKK